MITWSTRIEEEISKIENKGEVKVFYFPETIDFLTIDGYINFMITAINYILKYGKRNNDTNKYLIKIRGLLSKISVETVTYIEGTDFKKYENNVSKVLSTKINRERIKINEGYFGTLENIVGKQLIVLRYKDLRGRELSSTPDYPFFQDYVQYFILGQLDSLRVNKEKKARLLSEYNCHIEIIVAINYLIDAVNYLCRCQGGFNKDGLFISDRIEIEQLISLSEVIIKRIRLIRG